MTGARSRLKNRRPRLGFEMTHADQRYTVCVGFYEDGRIGELFLSTTKAGSASDGIARDAAFLFSLAIQHGCPLETIRAGLLQGSDGSPAGVLGHALTRALALIAEDP